MLGDDSKGTANAAPLANVSLCTVGCRPLTSRRSFGTDAAQLSAGNRIGYQHTLVIVSLAAAFAPFQPKDPT
jgi:hypothetical protein